MMILNATEKAIVAVAITVLLKSMCVYVCVCIVKAIIEERINIWKKHQFIAVVVLCILLNVSLLLLLFFF